MKYLILLFFISTLSFVYGQNDDNDEQPIFWDGYTEICYPPLDYDFLDTTNNGEINTEKGFIIQCHIPLLYLSTESPNIIDPKSNTDEVGIPQKQTYYFQVNFLRHRIQLFNCDKLIESYEILNFKNGKNKLVINCLWESGKTTIYLKRSKTPTFRQVKFDEQGELEGVCVNKEVKIFKIRQL